jgi:alkylhydroperoxidase family enzyme
LRIRTIIQFALKAADHAQDLTAEDYERVREQGITDEELMEIIHVVAVANYFDTLSDATKIQVDPIVSQALGR